MTFLAIFGECDPQCRTARQEFIEKVDREIAGNAAVRKNAFADSIIAIFRCGIVFGLDLVIEAIEWNGTNQTGKAKRHSRHQEDGHIVVDRQLVEVIRDIVPPRFQAVLLTHEITNHAAWKEFLEFPLAEIVNMGPQGQLVWTASRQIRGHCGNAHAMGLQLPHCQRPIRPSVATDIAGNFVNPVGHPVGECRTLAAILRQAGAETVVLVRQVDGQKAIEPVSDTSDG
ncbi:hypothetical protein [Rhizobium sp. RCC_161_2]|uniref:hypothetical protein n=1 Tax=Rhizobium sp. RCC_161_2 TaxID=3239219 RepID=UPI0035237A89